MVILSSEKKEEMEILNELSSLQKIHHRKASSIDRFMSRIKSIFTFKKKLTPTQSLVNSQSSANNSNKVSVKSASLGSPFLRPSLTSVFSKPPARKASRRVLAPLPSGSDKRIQYLKIILAVNNTA